MVHSLASVLSKYLVHINAIERDNQEIAEYGLFLLLTDIFQLFILLVVSLIFHIAAPMTLFCLFFCMLKRFIGGWHANSHFACVSVFTLMAVVSACLGRELPTFLILLIMAASVAIVVRKAPIPHPNNPKTLEQLRQFRVKALASVFIELITIGLMLAFSFPYAGCAALGSITASSTLLLAKEVL